MDSLAYSSNVKMRLSSTVMVGFGLGLALLDFSSPVDAAPGDGARAAPATSVPPALLKRPTSAPARQPFETLVVTTDGPSVQRIMPPKRVALADVSCKPSALKLDWPLDGAAGTTWTTHNYTDLDPSPGKKDWKGGVGDSAITYDGHRGYDIVVGSFREMDGNKVLARAAAPGKVIAIEESKFDRNLSCASNEWNYVTVQHANGFVTVYGHLKTNSVKLLVGATVKAGDALGTVGSSGCSTHPHLHFEIHDCENQWFDAAKESGMWKVPPAQHEVSGIMDIMFRTGGITSAVEIANPVGNLTHYPAGKLGIGLSAGLKAGDELTFLVLNGVTPEVWSWKPTGRYGLRLPSWNLTLKPGATEVIVWLNGEAKVQRSFTVE